MEVCRMKEILLFIMKDLGKKLLFLLRGILIIAGFIFGGILVMKFTKLLLNITKRIMFLLILHGMRYGMILMNHKCINKISKIKKELEI